MPEFEFEFEFDADGHIRNEFHAALAALDAVDPRDDAACDAARERLQKASKAMGFDDIDDILDDGVPTIYFRSLR
jgi:hypothetical protein